MEMDRDTLWELMELDPGETLGEAFGKYAGWSLVQEPEIMNRTRWGVQEMLIAQDPEGNYWRVNYMSPVGDGDSYLDEPAGLRRVQPVHETIIKWVGLSEVEESVEVKAAEGAPAIPTITEAIASAVPSITQPTFIPGRYPWTYSCDYLRNHPSIIPEAILKLAGFLDRPIGEIMSRAQASRIRTVWSLHTGISDEEAAKLLADAQLAEEGIRRE